MLQNYFIFVLHLKFFHLRLNWDIMGIGSSVACAIHCALLPVLLSSLPVFGINIIHNSFFEWTMIAIAFFIGCYALVHGYVRHHHNLNPFFLFFTGFIFLVGKQFTPQVEYLFLAFAIILIITAHFLNYQYCHRSKTCSSPHHKH